MRTTNGTSTTQAPRPYTLSILHFSRTYASTHLAFTRYMHSQAVTTIAQIRKVFLSILFSECSMSLSSKTWNTWQVWTHVVYMHVLLPSLDARDVCTIAQVSRTDDAWTRKRCRMWRLIHDKLHSWLMRARKSIKLRKDHKAVDLHTWIPQITRFQATYSRFTNFGISSVDTSVTASGSSNCQHERQRQLHAHAKKLSRLAQRHNRRH
jgi:hypothetical protein